MRKASSLLLLLPVFIHHLILHVSIPVAFHLAVVAGANGAHAIELNPNYVEEDEEDEDYSSTTSSGNDSDSEEDDYDANSSDDEINSDDSDSENENKNSKSVVNKALSLSKTTKRVSKTIQILQKHRTSITIAFALFAFRREISNLCLHLLTTTKTTKDGQTKRRLIVRMNPTAIIKIILFIDFMRKMQSGGGSGGGGGSSISSDGKSSGLIGNIVRDFLQPGNMAYIPPVEQHYTFENINERYTKDGNAWKKVTSSARSNDNFHKQQLQQQQQQEQQPDQKQSKMFSSLFNRTKTTDNNITEVNERGTTIQNETSSTGTTVILDMKLDSSVNSMSLIRDQISFLLHQHRLNTKEAATEISSIVKKNNTLGQEDDGEDTEEEKEDGSTIDDDEEKKSETSSTLTTTTTTDVNNPPTTPELEVVIILESPGGSATDYGLVSNLIHRLRKEPGIKLTMCVDKVAASGGYMIACMASPNQLYASPFAVVGSIGVYGQTLNIHNTLQNWGVQPLVFRGGKDKAPVGLVGEITKEGIAKVQGMIDKTHLAFKKHVVNARPILKDSIDDIATGDVWLGYDALDVGLVDKIMTSDEYIWDKIHNGEKVLKLIKFQKPRLGLFGSPKYGPGVPGIFHRMVQSVAEITNDIQSALHKVNKVLEEIPTSSNDFTKIVSATSIIDIRTQTKVPKC